MKQQYYTWQQFDKDCHEITNWIKGYNLKFKNIYGIPRGGLCMAVKLSHLLDIPLTNKISKETLIVDDISDTGETLFKLVKEKDNTVITLFYHEQSKFTPLLYMNTKKKLWIHYPWEK